MDQHVSVYIACIIVEDFLLSSSYKLQYKCYDLNSVLSKRHTFILSNTRELDRVSTTI